MKKILSLTLAALMLLSAVPMVHAADDTGNWSNGTTVSIVGQNDGYTVTVPATMEAGQTAQVTANGAWNNMQILRVTTPESVAVSYNGQSIDIGVTFDGISQRGSDISTFNIPKDITLEEVSTTFGTWTGVLEYNVELVDLVSISVTDVDGQIFNIYYEENMTWGEWVESDLNTEGYTIKSTSAYGAPKDVVVTPTGYVLYGTHSGGAGYAEQDAMIIVANWDSKNVYKERN